MGSNQEKNVKFQLNYLIFLVSRITRVKFFNFLQLNRNNFQIKAFVTFLSQQKNNFVILFIDQKLL